MVHGSFHPLVPSCIAILLLGCLDESVVAPRPRAPLLVEVLSQPNPRNSLSAVIFITAQNADSARVLYTEPTAGQAATPFYAVRQGSVSIPLLGLKPHSTYLYTVEAFGPGGRGSSSELTLSTSGLPVELSGLRMVQLAGAPSPGFLLTAFLLDSIGAVVAFDTLGEVCWYREFPLRPNEQTIDAQQNANGDFTVFVGASTGWQPTSGRFIRFSPAGDSLGSLVAGAPYYTDPHEILFSNSDAGGERVHLFSYDLRHVDLSAIGGASDVLLAGHTILRQAPDGSVEFLWSAWDHISLDDWILKPANFSQVTNTDFDHPNSLDIDPNGDYIVSFANLWEIMKIDGVTGRTVWRLGGKNNQFGIVGDPLGGFSVQHDVRLLPDGHLLVYDNGYSHTPPQSRAVEYALDLGAMTATMVWEYRHNPSIFTPYVGSVQRYSNGTTLVGFGGGVARVTEVAPSGDVLWEGEATRGGQPLNFFYRMRKTLSLYKAERP